MHITKITLILISLTGVAVLSACAGVSAGQAVTGTVIYMQRSALPPEALIKVQLQDISRADVPAIVLSEQTIKADGKQAPFPYSLPYRLDEIEESHTYRVAARIEDGAGKLLFISDTVIPVITRGAPTQDVQIVVVPVN